MGLLNRMWGSKQDRFARRVLAAISAEPAAEGAEAWYDPDEFAIHYRRGNESPVTAYLHQLYREVSDGSRAEQRERVAQYVQALLSAPRLPSEWELIAPLLRPVLRPGTFGLGMGRGLVVQSRPLAVPFLAEYVVIDQPAAMAYVTTNHHELWGVSAQQVYDTARANLAHTPPSYPAADEPALVRFVENGDSYWASRLLLNGELSGLADRVGGQPVAFVPDTAGVLVAPANPDLIAELFRSVERQYREAVRPISPQAYTVDGDGNLAVYQPPPGTLAATAGHKAALLLAAAEYTSQGEALANSEEAFCAKLILAEGNDAEGNDRVFTVASWADGVDTLLPKAEYIAFSGGAGEPFLASWDSVAAEVALTPVRGLTPQRFRARTWPAPDVMARLRASAVQL